MALAVYACLCALVTVCACRMRPMAVWLACLPLLLPVARLTIWPASLGWDPFSGVGSLRVSGLLLAAWAVGIGWGGLICFLWPTGLHLLRGRFGFAFQLVLATLPMAGWIANAQNGEFPSSYGCARRSMLVHVGEAQFLLHPELHAELERMPEDTAAPPENVMYSDSKVHADDLRRLCSESRDAHLLSPIRRVTLRPTEMLASMKAFCNGIHAGSRLYCAGALPDEVPSVDWLQLLHFPPRDYAARLRGMIYDDRQLALDGYSANGHYACAMSTEGTMRQDCWVWRSIAPDVTVTARISNESDSRLGDLMREAEQSIDWALEVVTP